MSSSFKTLRRSIAVIGFAAALLSACGHDAVRRLPEDSRAAKAEEISPQSKSIAVGERAAVIAMQQIGVPYRYGGSTRQGFDCSGLVQFAYAGAGRRIPRTTSEQLRNLAPIGRQDLQVGDLLFFNIAGKVAHVGLYLGNRKFVHAPATGRTVSVETLDSEFYRRAFTRAARP